MTEPEAAKALCRADTLLNMKHGLVRLDAVWGVGGGIRPVKYLVKQIMLLLKVLEALLLQMIACRFDACPRVEYPNSGRISAFRNAYFELRSPSPSLSPSPPLTCQMLLDSGWRKVSLRYT